MSLKPIQKPNGAFDGMPTVASEEAHRQNDATSQQEQAALSDLARGMSAAEAHSKHGIPLEDLKQVLAIQKKSGFFAFPKQYNEIRSGRTRGGR